MEGNVILVGNVVLQPWENEKKGRGDIRVPNVDVVKMKGWLQMELIKHGNLT